MDKYDFLDWLAGQIQDSIYVESVQVSHTMNDILVTFEDYGYEELNIRVEGLGNGEN